MIKMYCDLCGKEIFRNYVATRYKPRLDDICLEVMATKHFGISNQGHLCLECLKKVFMEGTESL